MARNQAGQSGLPILRRHGQVALPIKPTGDLTGTTTLVAPTAGARAQLHILSHSTLTAGVVIQAHTAEILPRRHTALVHTDLPHTAVTLRHMAQAHTDRPHMAVTLRHMVLVHTAPLPTVTLAHTVPDTDTPHRNISHPTLRNINLRIPRTRVATDRDMVHLAMDRDTVHLAMEMVTAMVAQATDPDQAMVRITATDRDTVTRHRKDTDTRPLPNICRHIRPMLVHTDRVTVTVIALPKATIPALASTSHPIPRNQAMALDPAAMDQAIPMVVQAMVRDQATALALTTALVHPTRTAALARTKRFVPCDTIAPRSFEFFFD